MLRFSFFRFSSFPTFSFLNNSSYIRFRPCLLFFLESAPEVAPRIPTSSLSQSAAVDETALPAASQNITAYAANTEPSQGYRRARLRARVTFDLKWSTNFPFFKSVQLYLFIRKDACEGTRVMAVGETPEETQNQNSSQAGGFRPFAKKTFTQCVVPDTMSSSFNSAESTHSQMKKPESKTTGGCTVFFYFLDLYLCYSAIRFFQSK